MIYWYDTLESTNNYAKDHLEEFDNLSVIAAKCQSKGRGQGDHSWNSEAGMNITVTIILKYTKDFILEARDAILITHIATSAIRKFLLKHGITSKIKWPNDIYVKDKKICGILIENILKGSTVNASMIGIGVNLNQTTFPSDLPNPISVKLLTGSETDLKKAVSELTVYFAESLKMAGKSLGREELKREFDENVFFVR